MIILRVLVMRMTMIIIMMLIISLSSSAEVIDDEDESDGQGTVYGDAETQKADNKSVMMMMMKGTAYGWWATSITSWRLLCFR